MIIADSKLPGVRGCSCDNIRVRKILSSQIYFRGIILPYSKKIVLMTLTGSDIRTTGCLFDIFYCAVFFDAFLSLLVDIQSCIHIEETIYHLYHTIKQSQFSYLLNNLNLKFNLLKTTCILTNIFA